MKPYCLKTGGILVDVHSVGLMRHLILILILTGCTTVPSHVYLAKETPGCDIELNGKCLRYRHVVKVGL